MHEKIFVRRTLEINGEMKSKKIETTVGRIIYNDGVPQDLGYVDRSTEDGMFEYEINFPVNKKKLGDLINRCISKHGLSDSAAVLDNVKQKGFHYSTISGLTYSMGDVKVPKEKSDILEKANKEVENVRKQYRRGLITEDERFKSVVNIWNGATLEVGEALEHNLEEIAELLISKGADINAEYSERISHRYYYIWTPLVIAKAKG